MSETKISVEGASKAVLAAVAVEGMPELLSPTVIKTDQDGIRKSLVKLDAAIHSNAVQCLMHAEKHGDTSLMRRLLIDIVDAKSGYRRQGLIAWMRRYSPMELKGDVIKLTGTVNGKPIPFDIKTANMTPFTSVKDFDEQIILKPVFKSGLAGRIDKALKDYRASIDNTLIKDGKVVGPIDPKKPYYNGIHLDKMDEIFDKIEQAAALFNTFSDETAEVEAARKVKAEAETYLSSMEKQVNAEAAKTPGAPEPVR